ncbi:HlyD family secretion protein [Uliginosibacterium aquaticum]|uniref:Biotin/lipoyl-binding protein n=1 Tax=Uliginosibacterium aquaticum TaxID=2731212 RepID=A0ABX2IGJ6_9RHOO|nr:biotin/lipoyl-binding protein [Uliginosibacterium aquaticum]NSL55622.1 biotin/lipoyl-binding protein [Uliginosibacterium aquaticum]
MKIRFRIPEAADPRREGGLSLPPQESKRVPPRLRWLLITLLALSPAIWVAVHFIREWLWVEARGFVMFEELSLQAPQDATVTELNLSSGSQVTQGSVLLRLDNPALRAEYEVLRAANVAASAKEAVAIHQAQLQSQRQTLKALQQRQAALHQRVLVLRDLAARDAATRGEVLAAEGEELALLGSIQAQQESILRSTPSPLPVVSASFSAEQRARLASLEARMGELTVRAPVAGTADNLMLTRGQRVSQGEPMLVLRHGRPHVVAFMQGRELGLTHSGETVRIVLPNRVTLQGRILGPAPSTRRLPEELAGTLDPRNQRLQVLIETDALPAEARIHQLPVTIRSLRFSGW